MSCHHALTTNNPLPILANDTSIVASYGILFTVANPSSPQSVNDGTSNSHHEVTISSLGFYVDTPTLSSYFQSSNPDLDIFPSISYEIYTMNGYYADPTRGGNNPANVNIYNGGGLPVNSSWDYRGDLSYWTLVADGSFGMDDLVVWPKDDDGVSLFDVQFMGANYFQVPFDVFTQTTISNGEGGSGGVQSFYVTLKEVGALFYSELDNWESMNDAQTVMHCGTTIATEDVGGSGEDSCKDDVPSNKIGAPTIHIGEGVVSYPFYDTSYFYVPRKFLGSIYYFDECPTPPPTQTPTIALSAMPTTSRNPSSTPTHSTPPSTLSFIDADQYGCHGFISTDRSYDSSVDDESVKASYGIVFPIQSNEGDGDGVWITSLGFHIDFNALAPFAGDDVDISVDYEVYALLEYGYYADPNRTELGQSRSFDYRGDLSYWEMVSNGTIKEEDLTSFSSAQRKDYFQIPWTDFQPTSIAPNGGIRSFYLTLKSGSFISKDLDRKHALGGIQKDDGFQDKNKDIQQPPMLLIGEGVIGYPFRDLLFLYIPKQYIGRVFYEYECPSDMPSISPSHGPTHSASPSLMPSVSTIPSVSPPSAVPSVWQSPRPSSSKTNASSLFTMWLAVVVSALHFTIALVRC